MRSARGLLVSKRRVGILCGLLNGAALAANAAVAGVTVTGLGVAAVVELLNRNQSVVAGLDRELGDADAGTAGNVVEEERDGSADFREDLGFAHAFGLRRGKRLPR